MARQHLHHAAEGVVLVVFGVGACDEGLLDVLPQEQGVEHRDAAQERKAANAVGRLALSLEAREPFLPLPGVRRPVADDQARSIQANKQPKQLGRYGPGCLGPSHLLGRGPLAKCRLNRNCQPVTGQAEVKQCAHERRLNVGERQVKEPVPPSVHQALVSRAGQPSGLGPVLHPHFLRELLGCHRLRRVEGRAAVGLGHLLAKDALSDLVVGDVGAERVLLAVALDVGLGWLLLVEGLLQLCGHPFIACALIQQAQLRTIAPGADLQVVLDLEQVEEMASGVVNASHQPEARCQHLRAHAVHPEAHGGMHLVAEHADVLGNRPDARVAASAKRHIEQLPELSLDLLVAADLPPIGVGIAAVDGFTAAEGIHEQLAR